MHSLGWISELVTGGHDDKIGAGGQFILFEDAVHTGLRDEVFPGIDDIGRQFPGRLHL